MRVLGPLMLIAGCVSAHEEPVASDWLQVVIDDLARTSPDGEAIVDPRVYRIRGDADPGEDVLEFYGDSVTIERRAALATSAGLATSVAGDSPSCALAACPDPIVYAFSEVRASEAGAAEVGFVSRDAIGITMGTVVIYGADPTSPDSVVWIRGLAIG